MVARAVVCVLLLTVALIATSPSVAQLPPSNAMPAIANLHGDWLWMLSAYGADPQRYRRALLDLGRDGVDDFPTPVLLAMADARLRGGTPEAARELCDLVVARAPGEPFEGWAALCSAWAGITVGDRDASIKRLEALAKSGSQSELMAETLLGLLDAIDGRLESAHYRFARVTGSGSDDLRAAGRFALGLARYWKHEYEPAAYEMRQLVANPPVPYFTDDARYLLARAELARGHEDEALHELRSLARLRRRAARFRDTAELLELEPGAVFHAATERYRRGRVHLPEAQVAFALNSDGGALARAFLHARGDAPPAPDAGEEAVRAAASAADASHVPRPATAGTAARESSRDGSPLPARSIPIALVVLTLVVLGIVVWRRSVPRNERAAR